MTLLLRSALPFALATALTASAGAQTTAPAKTPPKPATKTSKSAAKAPPKAPEPVIPEADKEQIAAAERVYYGIYDCEFNQSIDIVASPEHFGYVDLKLGKVVYVMKPVASSTGAIRLEDVRNETLMVQIASKSMLLNVKTGQRLVDACVSPKQRELIEAARAAKAAEAASAAAAGASAASASTPLLK